MFASSLPALVLASIGCFVQATEDATAKFEAFIQKHGRTYEVGSEEYDRRLQHFQQRLAAVEAHNRQSDRSWSAIVNHLADWAPQELAMLRGYRRSAPSGSSRASSLGLVGTSVRTIDVSHLPQNFTWKGQLAATRDVKNQGACGSCWAISSAAVLRAHAELYQQDRTFSTQQIVECTPNPRECGGQGGCQGATAELAMEYVSKVGLHTEEDHAYAARDGQCAKQMQVPEQGTGFPSMQQSFLGVSDRSSGQGKGGLSFGMTGWEKLPENLAEPLLLALYEKGPVVVSVGADDNFHMYSSGVMNACGKGAVINHAVVMVGYGKDNRLGFWQIQNSWGPSWGEQGFFRMARLDHAEENGYCGMDKKPEDGTGCKGGPSEVRVCGACGVLYDNVVPKFSLSEHGFLSRHSRDVNGVFTQISS